MKNQLLQTLPIPNSNNSYHIENTFSLIIQQKTNSARIKMMMLRDPINTADIPYAYEILNNLLPSVLSTECFNEQKLPFYKEVKRTEIGHLFEHILLEYMCQLKIAKGFKSAVYAGKTRWNWERDPRGLFHININCTQKDSDILPIALKKTIKLMKRILNNPNDSQPYQQYLFYHNGMKNGKKLKKK